jgi:hypothetical protein
MQSLTAGDMTSYRAKDVAKCTADGINLAGSNQPRGCGSWYTKIYAEASARDDLCGFLRLDKCTERDPDDPITLLRDRRVRKATCDDLGIDVGRVFRPTPTISIVVVMILEGFDLNPRR